MLLHTEQVFQLVQPVKLAEIDLPVVVREEKPR